MTFSVYNYLLPAAGAVSEVDSFYSCTNAVPETQSQHLYPVSRRLDTASVDRGRPLLITALSGILHLFAILEWPDLLPLSSLIFTFRLTIEKPLATLDQPLLIHVVVAVIDPTIPSLIYTNLRQSLSH